ncbi:hypothetical protein PR202_ga19192 [Eleusine coracana subsp. coracana]|uniref:F-box associated beta-propeller type 3 domain-containing protein n=1 Tax=Eleusine coracana subsp. coracana TaxID=191504 RepID=A0AAV5CV39_ELECO|nr:hypothetical protein PR202_ga19192 [Eleusine coracana subsp. coracana]
MGGGGGSWPPLATTKLRPWGYGRVSNTYKLVLSLRHKLNSTRDRDPPKSAPEELLVYTLGADREQPRLVITDLSSGVYNAIGAQSLYINGTIYLSAFRESMILAFDVDTETVTQIITPGSGRFPYDNPVTSELIQLFGRPCLVRIHGRQRVLWLLTVDHQWERRCVFKVDESLFLEPVKGIWDYAGVLVFYLNLYITTGLGGKLCLYQVATKKMLNGNLPRDLTPEVSDYAFCWGYRPTLVSPVSIVGELEQDIEGHFDCVAGIMEALALKPVNERDKRRGQKATLDTVCFMEFLIRIMQKMPDKMQDVIKMSLLR